MVSQAEKKFIIAGCTENLRYDGRGECKMAFYYILSLLTLTTASKELPTIDQLALKIAFCHMSMVLLVLKLRVVSILYAQLKYGITFLINFQIIFPPITITLNTIRSK